MFKSKKVKETYLNYGIEGPVPLYASWLMRAKIWSFNFIRRVLWKGYCRIRRICTTAERMYAYAQHARMSPDWDGAYVYCSMQFKLRRIKQTMLAGYHEVAPQEMKCLQESIKICGRLFRDRYDWVYLRQHDHKWGKLKMEYTPLEEPDGIHRYSNVVFSRPNAITEEEKQQERVENTECYKKGRLLREQDQDKLNTLIKNNIQHWWS